MPYILSKHSTGVAVRRHIICDTDGAPLLAEAGMYERNTYGSRYVPSDEEREALSIFRRHFKGALVQSAPNGSDWQNVRFEVEVNSA